MIYKKTCAECGKEFETASHIAKFCCEKCANRHHNQKAAAKRKQKPVIVKACAFCGKKFETINPAYKYCSVECRRGIERARKVNRDQTGRKREEQYRRTIRATMAKLARKSTVAKVNAAGRAQGLSYGKMMARKDGYYD